MSEERLRSILTVIKNDEFRVPGGTNVYELSLEMMEHIGSLDSELRDDLIYDMFCNWTYEKVLSFEELKSLLFICLDERHLFHGIGDEGQDSVFTRSFSTLFLANIIDFNNTESFLSKEDMIHVTERLLKYAWEERDPRGFVPVKGWAHTTAHTADALACLANYSDICEKELLQILEITKHKMIISKYAYVNYEDERMATAIAEIIARNILSEEAINAWLESFKSIELTKEVPNNQYQITNIKGFLRSIYFRLIDKGEYPLYTNTIKKVIYALHGYKFF